MDERGRFYSMEKGNRKHHHPGIPILRALGKHARHPLENDNVEKECDRVGGQGAPSASHNWAPGSVPAVSQLRDYILSNVVDISYQLKSFEFYSK